jgi:hypothetical protein
MAFAGSASAQAGKACSGTLCGLGGQIRGQIGEGLPLPISVAPGYTGPFKGGTTAGGANNVVIKTVPIFNSELGGFVGNGLGQQGQIKPTASATIMQTLSVPGSQGRAVTVPPNQFGFGPVPNGATMPNSIGVRAFNTEVLAVQTNLIFDSPHPGTGPPVDTQFVPTANGPFGSAPLPYATPTRMFSKGLAGGGSVMQGRPGLTTVSYYAGAPGSESNNFSNFPTANGALVPIPAAAGSPVNGVARFTATKNQFGGIATGRTLGTAMVYFNFNKLELNDLPCTGGASCVVAISTVVPATQGVAGGPFGGQANNDAFTTATGVYTATLGFNGTVIAVGSPLTDMGSPISFSGQPATSVGFPITTGRLTISVTDALPATERFVREGTDARDANGNGVIATVTGSMSARTISRGNANRTWSTYEIPEPSAIAAASAGLLALFGCHQLVRRRKR